VRERCRNRQDPSTEALLQYPLKSLSFVFKIGFLLVLLSPSLALSGEVTMDDLVKRNSLSYKKFSHVPFTGMVSEKFKRGSFRNGKKHGFWVSYDNDGIVFENWTGTYKNGVKVK